MYGPPNCSQDVKEAQEADDVHDVVDRRRLIAELLHEQCCRDGWLSEDAHGRPSPCHICHPGIEDRLARSRGTTGAVA